MIHKHSDFGYDAEQILLVIESILETKGHFQTKDYSTRLTKYSEHIVKDIKRGGGTFLLTDF